MHPPPESSPRFEEVYRELHRLAQAYMRDERNSHTLQPTALVHEAFVKLSGWEAAREPSRAQLLQLAARAMRQILVDHARGRERQKRRPDGTRITLSSLEDQRDHVVDVLEVHETLERPAALDKRAAEVAELRVFAGMTIDEVAETVGIAPSTVTLDWRMARAWLARELLD